ncbi:MAG TPA: citrate/2-methylcitrate synthase, partial [Candidatus Eremiobacteraceae bacterium]|nr:citrate/2-methylcitrate synthase [Candidatus Eremiobacteraceae bacterium]
MLRVADDGLSARMCTQPLFAIADNVAFACPAQPGTCCYSANSSRRKDRCTVKNSTVSVDPGLEGVVVGETALSRVAGEEGRLTYRGYDIADLAANASFEEVAYLLWHGRLPNASEFADVRGRMTAYRPLPEPILAALRTVPRDAWPMDVLRSVVSTVALYVPHRADGTHVSDADTAMRLTASSATAVAAWDRLRRGLEPIAPRKDLSHAANFLFMKNGVEPSEPAARALDTYFVLLADHGFNASTFAARVTASTWSDMYAAATAAVATLEGDLHGGAPGKVMQMILDIGTPDRAEAYVRNLVDKGGRVMGIGHREYKVRDPRAEPLEAMARTLGQSAGTPQWYDVAHTLEEIAVRVLDEKKPGRRLYANVEFYTAPTLYALGIEPDTFTCMFACSRMAGWTAHVMEQMLHNRLIRPQVKYTGLMGLP